MKTITIRQAFPQTIDKVFAVFSSHEAFGAMLGQKIVRIKDSSTDDKNGVGSIRRISMPLGMDFEETVTDYQHNSYIAYEISKGSPLKNHRGQMSFTHSDKGCFLHYEIRFESRWPIPFFSSILAAQLKSSIGSAIKRFAEK